jgi:hypothetical protein
MEGGIKHVGWLFSGLELNDQGSCQGSQWVVGHDLGVDQIGRQRDAASCETLSDRFGW